MTQKRLALAPVLFLTLALISGCSTVGTLVGNVNPVDTKSGTRVPELEKQFPKWKRISPQAESPDAEWQSDETAAIISLNSACRENLDGTADLKEITASLLSQWNNLTILSEKNLTQSGHPALETTAKGTYLRRIRKFQTVTVHSDHCIYDLIFLSPVETFDQDLSVFQKFRDNLVLK